MSDGYSTDDSDQEVPQGFDSTREVPQGFASAQEVPGDQEVPRGFDSCQEIYPEYNQFAQITTHFPISWRNNYNSGTGGIDLNLSKKHIQVVFGDSIWYITKSDDLTIGMVFDQIYHSTFLGGRSYRFELDAWCAMNTDEFFALPFNKAFLCQGQLYLN